MPSFLDDISSFYGTGEKNEKGQTLEEFLKEYDPYQYKNPCATTDMVLFSYAGEKPDTDALKVLLVCRKNHPSIGYWALPGGFVELYENLEDTARRELEEETGVKGLPVEQFACYGDYQRDPRARVITTAYFSLVNEKCSGCGMVYCEIKKRGIEGCHDGCSGDKKRRFFTGTGK